MSKTYTSEFELMPRRAPIDMLPNAILHVMSDEQLDKLIQKAMQEGFERGQKKPIEKPLTREEAAAFLRIEPATLDRWLKSRKLPVHLKHVIGIKTILFFASDLEEFIKKS